MRCFYSADFELELPEGHPFPMRKFRQAKDMLLDGGVLRPEEVIEVTTADVHRLNGVHDKGYVERIRSGLLDRKEQVVLGLPVTPHLFTRSATEVEATRLTCRAALEEGVAICMAGGTHHAFHGHGEGYCVFNDVAVAIRDLQVFRPGIRVMVVDTDAH
jgi:acetoin utilization deacetylase AcuC-like enzyme